MRNGQGYERERERERERKKGILRGASGSERPNVRMPGQNDSGGEEVSHYLEHLAKFLD